MFLTNLLECSVAMSVISLLYLIALPLLSKRYSAKWLYYIWLVVVIGFIFPFRPHIYANIIPYQIPKIQVIHAQYISVARPLNIVFSETSRASSISLWWVIGSIWAICAVGNIAYNTWKHGHFLKMVNRWSENFTNPGILDVLDTLKTEMKIRTYVGLKTCPVITSPMMVGFSHPTILLPSIKIDSEELTFILKHELVHLKRKDLWHKALVLVATAIHWFNPVVYLMAKAIAMQCEISCDEQLAEELSLHQREQYCETLIGVVRNGVMIQTELSTNFYREGNFIKTRIFRIMDESKKKTGIAALCIILIAIMGSRVTFASGLARGVSAETQSKQGIFRSAKNKQVINIEVKKLESGKFVFYGGPYTLEEGNVIKYDIRPEENNANLMVKFLKDDIKTCDGKTPLHELTLIDHRIQNPDNQVKVTQSQAGNYCLFILNETGGVPSNIKGTIKITKGR